MCFNSLYSFNSLMTLWYTAKAGYSSERVINTMVSGVYTDKKVKTLPEFKPRCSGSRTIATLITRRSNIDAIILLYRISFASKQLVQESAIRSRPTN